VRKKKIIVGLSNGICIRLAKKYHSNGGVTVWLSQTSGEYFYLWLGTCKSGEKWPYWRSLLKNVKVCFAKKKTSPHK
jgi:hypothetical protein